jgi:hypothetical protein
MRGRGRGGKEKGREKQEEDSPDVVMHSGGCHHSVAATFTEQLSSRAFELFCDDLSVQGLHICWRS